MDMIRTASILPSKKRSKRTSHIVIRYTRATRMQKEFVIPNFFIHFWYSDVTVKRNETTILPFKPQRSHADDGWWSGWQRQRGCYSSKAVSNPSFCVMNCDSGCQSGSMTRSEPNRHSFVEGEVRLTKRRKHRRQQPCRSPCTPRYRQPCA